MSAFAENPFFFFVDNAQPFFPLNLYKDTQKIVELSDVACDARRSFTEFPDNPDAPSLAPNRKNETVDDEWDYHRKEMKHNFEQSHGGTKHFYLQTAKDSRDFPQQMRCQENSQLHFPKSPIPSHTYQNYPEAFPKRKLANKKPGTSKIAVPGKEAWARYWARRRAENRRNREKQRKLNEYALLQNRYQFMRENEPFQGQEHIYYNNEHRKLPTDRFSKVSTNVQPKIYEFPRRPESEFLGHRQSRWQSFKSPIYNEQFYLPQQIIRDSCMHTENNLTEADYRIDKSDGRADSLRSRKSRIRSRTYSPPIDKCKLSSNLVNTQYADENCDEFLLGNFPDQSRISNIDRVSTTDSQASILPESSMTSSGNIHMNNRYSCDYSGSSLDSCGKKYDNEEKEDAQAFWEHFPLGYMKKGSCKENKRCSSSRKDYPHNFYDNLSASDCLNPGNVYISSKHGSGMWSSKRRRCQGISRGSNPAGFISQDSSQSTSLSSVLSNTNFQDCVNSSAQTATDPAKVEEEGNQGMKILYTSQADKVQKDNVASDQQIKNANSIVVQKSESKGTEEGKSNSSELVKDKLTKKSNAAESTTGFLKRKFSSTKSKASAISATSSQKSIKSTKKKTKSEVSTSSKLPVRINRQIKTNPKVEPAKPEVSATNLSGDLPTKGIKKADEKNKPTSKTSRSSQDQGAVKQKKRNFQCKKSTK